jgi:hypothetical protein
MTTKKEDPFTIDESRSAAGLEDDDAVKDYAAREITSIMQAVLTAAVGVSHKPGLALSAVRLAGHALRVAILDDGVLSKSETDAAELFADSAHESDAQGTGAALARREIHLRGVHAHASRDEIQSVLEAATACLDGMGQRGSVHPITQLVILYAAREMALAMLKHQFPDEYEEMLVTVRAMENSVRPGAIEVIPMSDLRPMSKGGSA